MNNEVNCRYFFG